MIDYKQKYLKYKTKYNNLKNNFYFIHNTSSIKTLISILKKGKILLGSDVKEDERKHSGGKPMDYIFGHIYFEDLKNLSNTQDFAIILHPKIIKKYDIIFNKGWQAGPGDPKYKRSIQLLKSDDVNTRNIKITQIRKFLKNPHADPNISYIPPNEFLQHEVVFDKPILLKDNIIGIICLLCDTVDDRKKYFDKLQNIINEKYPNVKFYKSNAMPLLKDLL